MELIKITNGDYSEYENLLLKRDELEKAANLILLEYTKIFGDITTDIFKIKIDCIALKKAISYCVMLKNRGEQIDSKELQNFIEEKLALYQNELNEMIRKNEISKKSEKISSFQLKEIKRIYRSIAKLLHPDMSNITKKHPTLAELFQRVMIVYHCNDYKEIKELEVLVNRALDDIGEEKFEIVISNIKEKIEELENEIKSITTTEPYIYSSIIDDVNKINEKMKEFEDELKSYSSYKLELENSLKNIQE